jgi:hypothetical protein
MVPVAYPGHGLQFSRNVTILDETQVSPAPDIRPLRVPKNHSVGNWLNITTLNCCIVGTASPLF